MGIYKYFKEQMPEFTKEEVAAMAILGEMEPQPKLLYENLKGEVCVVTEVFWPYKCICKHTEWLEGKSFGEGSIYHTPNDSVEGKTGIAYMEIDGKTGEKTYYFVSVVRFANWLGWKKGDGVAAGELVPQTPQEIPPFLMAQLNAQKKKNEAANKVDSGEGKGK